MAAAAVKAKVTATTAREVREGKSASKQVEKER